MLCESMSGTQLRAGLHTHTRLLPAGATSGWKEKEKRERKERGRRGWETGGGRKARRGKTWWMFSATGWRIAAGQRNESSEKPPLHALRGVHRRYPSWAGFGLNGDKRGKMQWETGRREGKVQRERDSQSTEFLQALSDPHNQQGSSWQQGI